MTKGMNSYRLAEGRFCITLGTLLLFVFLSGCFYIKSESAMIGEYTLKGSDNNKIELALLPDKTFTETIFWGSGKVEKRFGKWKLGQDLIDFDPLWIPPAFAPAYIRATDAQPGTQPKYTEPGHWILTPENRWGTPTLEIFPDADISFKMTKRLRQ